MSPDIRVQLGLACLLSESLLCDRGTVVACHWGTSCTSCPCQSLCGTLTDSLNLYPCGASVLLNLEPPLLQHQHWSSLCHCWAQHHSGQQHICEAKLEGKVRCDRFSREMLKLTAGPTAWSRWRERLREMAKTAQLKSRGIGKRKR